jgi:hypothetical protein
VKRIFILLVIGLVAASGFAVEKTLIDFSQLDDDTTVGNRPEHGATLIDFSDVAGTSVDAQTRALMQSSLYIGNWEVELNSSAKTAMSQTNSKIAKVYVRTDADEFGGQAVLGVRVQFPTEPYNAWALVKPPFEIQSDFVAVEGQGVVDNVGVIKQVGVWVYGLNYPHTLSVILQDQNYDQQEIILGPLNFDGWRQLIWDNPNYIDDVRDRELRSYPLYPSLTPMRKVIGFRIYRDGSNVGGDFVAYLHDAKIVYDLALLDIQAPFETEDGQQGHDAIWGIIADREQDRKRAETRRLGDLQVLRTIEQELQAQEDLRNTQQ